MYGASTHAWLSACVSGRLALAWATCVSAHRPHDSIFDLGVSPDGQSLLATSRGSLYRSSDAGLSWELGGAVRLAGHSDTAGTFGSKEWFSTHKAHSSGTIDPAFRPEWTPRVHFTPADGINSTAHQGTVYLVNPSVGCGSQQKHARAAEALYHSDDGGVTWVRSLSVAQLGSDGGIAVTSSAALAIAKSVGQGPGVLVVGARRCTAAGTKNNAHVEDALLLRSTDGGKSFGVVRPLHVAAHTPVGAAAHTSTTQPSTQVFGPATHSSNGTNAPGASNATRVTQAGGAPATTVLQTYTEKGSGSVVLLLRAHHCKHLVCDGKAFTEVDSVQECALKCAQEAMCLSFSYSAHKNVCRLSQLALSGEFASNLLNNQAVHSEMVSFEKTLQTARPTEATNTEAYVKPVVEVATTAPDSVWPQLQSPDVNTPASSLGGTMSLLSTDWLMYAGTGAGHLLVSADTGLTWSSVAYFEGVSLTAIVELGPRGRQRQANTTLAVLGRRTREPLDHFTAHQNAVPLKGRKSPIMEFHKGDMPGPEVCAEKCLATPVCQSFTYRDSPVPHPEIVCRLFRSSEMRTNRAEGFNLYQKSVTAPSNFRYNNTAEIIVVSYASQPYSWQANATHTSPAMDPASVLSITRVQQNIRATAATPPGAHRLVQSLAATHTNGQSYLFAVSTPALAVLRSADLGVSWQELAADQGLEIATEHERVRWKAAQFAAVSCPRDVPGMVFVGGFNGVYKSINSGDSWVHLDIHLRVITALHVAPGLSPATFFAGMCTYADGCYGGEFLTNSSQLANTQGGRKFGFVHWNNAHDGYNSKFAKHSWYANTCI